MDELVKQLDAVMSTNPAAQYRWSRMTEIEKKEHAALCYIRSRMKNWIHLPAEIKLECIKEMDFKRRLKLRATARQERELVDSMTIDLPFVQFCDPAAPQWDGRGRRNPYKSFGTAQIDYPTTTLSSSVVKTASLRMKIFNDQKYMSAIHLLAYVLKLGNIEKLDILETYSPDRFDRCAEILEKSAPFRVKNVDIVAKKMAVFMFLKNLELSGLDTVRLHAENSSQFPMDELVAIPAITSCKLLQIRDLLCEEHPVKLVQKWIENDSPVGTKLMVSVRENGLKFVSKFKEMFVERIESQQAERVKIRTNNPAKCVLLKFCTGQDDYIFYTIIRSDFEDSEAVEEFKLISSCYLIGSASPNHEKSMWDEPEEDPFVDMMKDLIADTKLFEAFPFKRR